MSSLFFFLGRVGEGGGGRESEGCLLVFLVGEVSGAKESSFSDVFFDLLSGHFQESFQRTTSSLWWGPWAQGGTIFRKLARTATVSFPFIIRGLPTSQGHSPEAATVQIRAPIAMILYLDQRTSLHNVKGCIPVFALPGKRLHQLDTDSQPCT